MFHYLLNKHRRVGRCDAADFIAEGICVEISDNSKLIMKYALREFTFRLWAVWFYGGILLQFTVE
jgi:hypothetical protein